MGLVTWIGIWGCTTNGRRFLSPASSTDFKLVPRILRPSAFLHHFRSYCSVIRYGTSARVVFRPAGLSSVEGSLAGSWNAHRGCHYVILLSCTFFVNVRDPLVMMNYTAFSALYLPIAVVYPQGSLPPSSAKAIAIHILLVVFIHPPW